MRAGKYACLFANVVMFITLVTGCESKTDTSQKDKKDAVKKNDPQARYHPGHSPNGHVYKTEGLDLTVAAKVDAEHDTGILTIYDKEMKNEQFIAVDEITVKPPSAGKEEKVFKLPGVRNEEDKASKFALEDPALAAVMAGDFWVTFELDGKEYKYWIFDFKH